MATNGKSNGKSEQKKVRFAAVGAGHIVQVAVLPAFEHAENAELVALVSGDEIKREEIPEKYPSIERVVDYDGFDELLDSGLVDAVYIGLPNDMHEEYTVRAAEKGVHVLCEKPMAPTEEACQRMIDACRENDVRLMIAYRLHFDEANMEVAQKIEEGAIGQPRYFTSTISQDVQAGDIRLAPIEEGGGTVFDMGIYCINAARYLFRDEPTSVFATSASRQGDDRFSDCDEMTHAVLRYPGERIASFTSSFGSSHTTAFRMVGSDAELKMDPAYGYSVPLRWELLEDGSVKEARTYPKRDQFAPELIHFSRCVLEGRDPEPGGKEGKADVRIIRAIYESARTGKPVELEPLRPDELPSYEQTMRRPGVEMPEVIHEDSPSR